MPDPIHIPDLARRVVETPTIGAQLDAIIDAEDDTPEPPEAPHKFAPAFDGCGGCMFVYGPHCASTCIYHPNQA